ncbi:predicted protein [Plenodomus lingam JN3]|uniref:Predicted protein n=1 Tax=Leptosphaeria maculans (strain JN3 / isolate v23.1.3 / race Av1-4-5-6-7-8) TaxID=985895 RepID=E5A1P7_LEPMJ|nr:predicted protein [Plenodomus lingam JN3]CBX97614.1 predicted protein [Plenodomus lingam JN3]
MFQNGFQNKPWKRDADEPSGKGTVQVRSTKALESLESTLHLRNKSSTIQHDS